MNYRTNKIEEVTKELQVDLERGLTSEQVEANREKYGRNQFEEGQKSTLLSKIGEQFKEVMNLILLFAGFLSLYIAAQDPSHGFSEPIIIFLIILINMAVTIYQEGKAEDALSALKDLSSPTARVLRDGQERDIPAEEVVHGDIILLQAGEGIPADARLIQANNLQVEESSLTGESVPVDKDPHAEVEEGAPIGDVFHTVFSGTSVTNGNGRGVVVGVGMDSEMGSIAGMLTASKDQKTPLQSRIDTLAKRLAVLAFVAGAVIFAINAINSDMPMLENLMLAVSLAIAAVPETLPVIVTLSLAYGVQNMAGRHAIIRNMPAVETLGSASVIASDKTGTLTQNKMSIQRIWSVAHEPKSASDSFDEAEERLVHMLALASNAKAHERNGEQIVEGDSTEAAIITLLNEKGWSKEELEAKYPRVSEIPFDSTRKRMTTIHEYGEKFVAITKGALGYIPMTIEGEAAADPHEVHDSFAEKALRVLGVSYKFLDERPEILEEDEIEQGMTFAGMVGMIDPPREESMQAVQEARNAGIRPIMITGDHAKTALAIAEQIGISQEGDKAITGQELQKLSDEELNNHIEEYAVYARVSPEDKIRIVKAWQNKGEVVAMTGDGVNDAPSLQAADVGTAMGDNGTEVAKNASDMVLTDDNFATIVHAVEEGRTVYENIRKTIYFLLSANVAEILIMLIATLLGWGVPLLSTHLLFINVIADGIPGFGLSREKADANIMEREPVNREESIFARGGYKRIAIASTTFVIVTLLAFYVGVNVAIGGIAPSLEVGQTMAFLVLGWASTIQILEVRTSESIFKVGITENKSIFWTTLFAVILTALMAAVPALANVFSLVALSTTHWLLAIVLALVIIVVIEIEKFIVRRR